jgi:CBS domain-containing protein
MKTTAQDIMSIELLTIQEGSSLEDALKILLNNRITGMPVVNKENELVGVVSEYDLMVQISEMAHMEAPNLGAAFKFSHKVTAIPSTTDLNDIIQLFVTKKYRRLPVLNAKKKLVGIITRHDLMKLFYYRSRLA